MRMDRRILGVIHDPGACGMLLPVFRELSCTHGKNFFLYASPFVKNRLSSNQISFKEIESDLAQDRLESVFSASQPDIVLTGTSWGSQLEQRVRNLAGLRKIKSVTVVDYWASYLERWEGRDLPVDQIQDEICVIDDFMKKEMIENGFPSNQIYVTGHPYFEELTLKAKPHSFSSIGKVLLLSEPLRDPFSSHLIDSRVHHVAEILQRLAENLNSRAEVHFKTHPKENPGLPSAFGSQSWNRLSFKLADSQLRSPDDFAKFDLVIGYQTTGLLEAAIMGIPTISVPVAPLSGAVANAFRNAGILVVEPQEKIEKIKFEFKATSKAPHRGATQVIMKFLD